MATFDELKKKIKACKTHAELDELRLPLVRFVPEGGEVDDFYKLQKMFRSQKVVASRLPSTIERRERKAAQHSVQADTPTGDGIKCPICGEVNYCIHRDN